jgi:hypothetical protein
MPGPLGSPTNNPIPDAGTSPITQHRPSVPRNGNSGSGLSKGDRFSEKLYFPVTAFMATGYRKALFGILSDTQGRYILETWLAGMTDEVTLASDGWGDYMRAEPDLQDQIYAKLKADADDYRKNAQPVRKDYYGRFHGDIGHHGLTGGPNGGYLTGYQLLHGSKHCYTRMTVTGVREVKISEGNETMPKLRDVEIIGKVNAGGNPYKVTFEHLRFIWNDIINPNSSYEGDNILARYGAFENRYTGHIPPRDYVVHITWEDSEAVTFGLGDD